MPLRRALAVLAAAIAIVILVRASGDRMAPSAEPVAAAGKPALPPADPRGAQGQAAAIRTATPSLPDDRPFRAQDLAMTSDPPDGPLVALRSSVRVGRSLAVELASREPLPEGKRVFATVSVSDGLGNTIMDCAWRDIELTGDDARTLDCELPVDVALPLAISGHQRSAPSYVETPTVVAVDKGVQR